MPLARRSSEVRQAELVEAALQIIATRGIAALTTRSLADEIGLTTGAIFRHFASLDALLDAVVARIESVLDACFPAADLPARSRLERFVEARTAAVAEQLPVLPLIVSEQFRLALPRTAAERLLACMHKSRAFIVRCVREGQKTGEIRDDVGAEELAVIVMGTMQALARGMAGAEQHGSRRRAVREVLFVLLEPPPGATLKSRRRSR